MKTQAEVTGKVAKLIYNARVKKGMSLESVAEKVGVSKQAICLIEHGVSAGRLCNVINVFGVLGISLTELE